MALIETNLSDSIRWATGSIGTLAGTGALPDAIPINPSNAASFFKLRMP